MSTQRLAFYAPSGSPVPNGHDLAGLLDANAAVSLRAGDADYHAGEWLCPKTGARATIDCGTLPIQEQETGLNQDFEGWDPIPLAIQIPLAAPHWWSVEVAAWLEGLLVARPDWGLVDEGELGPDDDIQPGPIRRPAILASWEAQHRAYAAGLEFPHMDRRESLALWRYRRERSDGQQAHEGLLWPQSQVLAHGHHAYSTIIWPAEPIPVALPPVHFVAVQREGEAGLLSLDEVMAAANQGVGLDQGGARRVDPSQELAALLAHAPLTPPSAYAALADGEWSD